MPDYLFNLYSGILTYPAHQPKDSIDHILVSTELGIENYHSINHNPGYEPSDHRPIIGDVFLYRWCLIMDFEDLLKKDKVIYERLKKERDDLDNLVKSCLKTRSLIIEFRGSTYCLYKGYCSCQGESGYALKSCEHYRVIRYLSIRQIYED